MLFSGKITFHVAARLTPRFWVPHLLGICHYSPLFPLFAIRYSGLFAIIRTIRHYSGLFAIIRTIRYSVFGTIRHYSHYSPLFGTIRHYSHYSLFGIRDYLLFAIRDYSLFGFSRQGGSGISKIAGISC